MREWAVNSKPWFLTVKFIEAAEVLKAERIKLPADANIEEDDMMFPPICLAKRFINAFAVRLSLFPPFSLISRVWAKQNKRETAIGYKKAKTNRNWVQILHFYHAKTVNTDIRLLWRSVASTKEF